MSRLNKFLICLFLAIISTFNFNMSISSAEDQTDIIIDESKQSINYMNDNFRRTTRRLRELENGIPATHITGILGTLHGGTGQDFSAVAQNAIPYFSAIGTMGNIGIGTTGYVLTAGSPPNWQAPTYGNVVYSWTGQSGSAGGKKGIYVGTTTNPNGTTDTTQIFMKFLTDAGVSDDGTTTFLSSKFKKIAGISNLAMYARMWVKANSGCTFKGRLNVNGSTADTGAVVATSPTWVNTGNLDVSGLVNGTVYDLSIQINLVTNSQNDTVYFDSVIVFIT